MEEDRIKKWHRSKKNIIDCNEEDKGNIRKIVWGDFFKYFTIYTIPPLAKVLNQYCEYPLPFLNTPWIIGSTLLMSIVTLSCIISRIFFGDSAMSNFEIFGGLFTFLLKAFLTALLEAMNFPANPLKSLELNTYEIYDKKDPENRKTAEDLYNAIMAKSKFFLGRKRITNHGTFMAGLIGFSLILIPFIMRKLNNIPFFGYNVAESVCIIISDACIFSIISYLFVNFFDGFALYRSMTSSMIRFKNSMTSPWHNNKKRNSRYQVEILVDMTNRKNLKAWLMVHRAISLRRNEFEARILKMGATVGVILVIVSGILIVLGTFENKKIIKEMDDISSLVSLMTAYDNVGLYMITYIVLMLGICLCVLSYVGSNYNYAAKNAITRTLYDIELEVAFNDGDLLESAEQDKVKKIIGDLQRHMSFHVHDLGILGVSFDKVFWSIFGVVSSLFTRQLIRFIF